MIEWLMFGALGFFLGCLLALMLAPPLWNRAVKLTTRRLEATMPMSLADIQATKDQLRAEFAIELRKLEVALDKAKEKAARELIEANKRRVEIQVLNSELAGVKAQLQENENANRVLQQTIKRRLPDLDSRLKAAKKALADLETVNTELRNTVGSQSEALKIARATVHNQRADIDRLRVALESGSAAAMRGSRSDARLVAESQRLTAEISRTQEELERARTSAQENVLLRRELTKLASQLMAATRQQGLSQPHIGGMTTQAFVPFAPAAQPEPQREATWQGIHAGNGAGHEATAEHASATEAEPAEAQYVDEEAQDEAREEPHPSTVEQERELEAEESSESKGSLAKRIAARRARRRDTKSNESLADRLRGLTIHASDTRS